MVLLIPKDCHGKLFVICKTFITAFLRWYSEDIRGIAFWKKFFRPFPFFLLHLFSILHSSCTFFHLCVRCSLTLIRRVHLRSSSRPIHGDIWPPSIIHWEFLTNLTIVLNEQILLIFCADFLPHVSYIKQNQQQFLWEKNILRKGNNPLRTCWWLSGQVILGKMQKKAHHHHYQQHHQHLHCHQHHHRSWKYLYCVPFHKRIPNWNKHVTYQNRGLC